MQGEALLVQRDGPRVVPEPAAYPDEAIIAVYASSLNRGELALLAGRPEGWRPGQDIAGVVATPAADGSGPRAGARVVGLVEGAGWSQRVAVPVSRLAALPDPVSFAAAAALPMAGLTAQRTSDAPSCATEGVTHLAVIMCFCVSPSMPSRRPRPSRRRTQ